MQKLASLLQERLTMNTPPAARWTSPNKVDSLHGNIHARIEILIEYAHDDDVAAVNELQIAESLAN